MEGHQLTNAQSIAREMYDRGAQNVQSVALRQNSEILHLRQFNNWVKSALIDKYCPSPYPSILDMACGRGGDVPKWILKQPSSIIFMDISRESLKECFNKFTRKTKGNCKSSFIVGDSFSCDLRALMPEASFHIASCQLSFHYCFQSEQLARSAIRNLTSQLCEGGHVIITIPNACKIVALLRRAEPNEVVQNSLYKITRKFQLDNIPSFGAEYNFFLTEGVENVPEYLVHPAVLTQLFAEYGMELVDHKGFQEYYEYCVNENTPHKKLFYDLLLKLNHMENADMTKEEWEVCGLYCFFVFRKGGQMPEMPSKNPSTGTQTPRQLKLIDSATGAIETIQDN